MKKLGFSKNDTTTEYGRSRERYRLIALSSFSSVLAKILTSLLGLVTVPLTINYLGKEQFGIWMVVSSLVIWMQLADFGISNGLTNALAEAYGRGEREKAVGYVSTSLLASALTALICIGPLIGLAYFLPWESLLKLQNPAVKPLVTNCFIVAGLLFVINLPPAIVNRIFIAYQLGYIVNLTQAASSLISLVGLLIAIKLKLSLPMLVMCVSLSPVIGNIVSWRILKRNLSWMHVSIRFVSWCALKRVAHSSIPMFVYLTGSMLTCQLVNIIIAQVGSLNMVADYNILLKIYMLIFTLGISFSAPFYPAIREAFERQELNWVKKSIARVILIRTAVILLPAILLFVRGDWLIQVWIKKPLESAFGFYGWAFFSVCLILFAIYSTISEILVSLDKIWAQNVLLVVSSILALFGQYLMIPILGLKAFYLVSSVTIIFPIIYSIYSLRNLINSTKGTLNG